MIIMEQFQSEVYSNTLALLSQDTEGNMKKTLETILEWEKTHPPKNEYDGFEWHSVFTDARTLNSLVTRRILRVVLKTNKYCCYRAVDLQAIEKALADYEGSFTQVVTEEQMPSDLFDVVVGHSEKKDIIKRSLKAEKPVHILLWGTVASAKTLMLEELSRLPNSRMVLGSALTRAGIFDVLFNERPKYVLIDELEKIDSIENLSALLSLMERGLVTETKYRRHRTIRLKTWVFGSCNEIQHLPRELLSRFLLLRFRDYTPEEFYEVTVNVLNQREGISQSLAVYIAEMVLSDLNSRDVRDCVRIGRLLKDRSKEEVNKIVEILKRQK